MEIYGESWKNAWDRIAAKLFTTSDGDPTSPPQHSRFQEFVLHPDLRRMRKQLNPKIPSITQESLSFEAFVHLNLVKGVHRYTAWDESDINDFIQGSLPYILLCAFPALLT